MRKPWWRVDGTAARAPACVLLVAVHAWVLGCGRTSKSHGAAPTAGTLGDAGQESGAGQGAGIGGGGLGNAGSGRSAGGSGGATGGLTSSAGTHASAAAAGTAAAGSSGAPTGNGGVAPAAGGTAGDVSDAAGGSPGGSSGNECRDLCAPGAPACCVNELHCVSEVPSCRIDVLADAVGVTYEYADLEQKIAALSGDVLLSVSDTEVDWAAADPPSASRFELHLSREATQAKVDALTAADGHPFRVSCNEQPLFVGVIYLSYGAAALRTPVLHVEEAESDALVLRLGAWQGAWLTPNPEAEPALRERLDRPELRATFCARGVLRVLDAP